MKELTDVTLEDVVRYRGSRWKAKLDNAGVDRNRFIDQLAQFLNDIPDKGITVLVNEHNLVAPGLLLDDDLRLVCVCQ